jgi:hypothetical protein
MPPFASAPAGATDPPVTVEPDVTSEPVGPTSDPASGDSPADAIIDATIQNLRRGSFLIAAPNPMRVGESYRVVIRLTKELTPTASFHSELPTGSDPAVEPVLLGTLMAVKLQGDSPGIFEIAPSDAVPHAVASKGYTEWGWDVRPLRSGNHQLEAVVSVRILIPGQGEPETVDYDTLRYPVLININPLYTTESLLRDYWPLWALLLAVLVGLLALQRLRPDLIGGPGRRQRLEALRERYQRNLDQLELQIAAYGDADVPLRLINGVDQAKAKLAEIDAQLQHLAAKGTKAGG